MTSNDFNNYLKASYPGSDTKVDNIFIAAKKMGLLAKYNDHNTAYQIATCLWTIAACRSTRHVKIVEWLKEQARRTLAAIQDGAIKEAPFHILGDILADYEEAKKVESIAIDHETGAIHATWKNGKREILSAYSTIHSDEIKHNIREITIFPSDFITMLAMMIRVGEAGASVERDKAAQAAREQLAAVNQ